MDPLTIAMIGAQVLGQAGQAIATGSMNKKTRKFTEHMYNRQRADALADYHMNNEYNSPIAQRSRLAAAGLNPALIYGKGAGDMTAGPVRSSNAPSWNPESLNIGGIATAAQNALMASVDIANKEAQNELLKDQSENVRAQTLKTSVETDTSRFDLGMKNKLAENTEAIAEENLRRLKTGTDIMLTQEERAVALHAPNLEKAYEEVQNLKASRAKTRAEISNIKEQTENLKKDGKLKDLDLELKRMGIQPGDNLFMRVLGRVLADPESIGNTIAERLKKGSKNEPYNRAVDGVYKNRSFFDFGFPK